MIVFGPDPRSWPDLGATSVALGVFDGVHLGHRAVIRAAVENGRLPTVLTFGNHPATVLDPASAPSRLTSLERRLELISDLGVEVAAVIPFDDDLRLTGADEFIARYLVDGLRARHIAVGEGFRFGHGARGSVELLVARGVESGFGVTEVSPVRLGDREVRSTAIREAIASGDVEEAASFLGRPHEVEGTVVPGDGRGRTIGFPTANIDFDPLSALPRSGVYAVWVSSDGLREPGVVNLGVRPTFDGTRTTLEAHLLDWEGDLYGRKLRVEFVRRIRDEKRFDSIDELSRQIREDVGAARAVLAQAS